MRLIVIFIVAIFLFFGAFTFYYYNTGILLQPASTFVLDGSLAPIGASAQGTNGVLFDGVNYIFYHLPAGSLTADVVYGIDINHADINEGLLNVYDYVSNTYPVFNGGTSYRNSAGVVLSPLQFSQSANTVLSHQRNGDVVSLSYIETFEGVTTEKRLDIEIKGKTLIVRSYAVNPSTSPNNNYAGFNLGKISNVSSARAIQVPYMKTATVSVINNEYFISNYIDWTKSNSNDNPVQNWPLLSGSTFTNSFSSNYIPGQNNVYNSLDDTAYITVSDKIQDTFMKIHRQKSQYRDDLNKRVVFEIYALTHQMFFDNSNPNGRFYPNAKYMIDTLGDYGLRDLFFVLHSSIATTPNGVAYNKVCPTSQWYGSQEDFIALKNTVYSYGGIFAPVHDDKGSMFQSSPYWNNYSDADRNPINPHQPDFPIAINPDGKCALSSWYIPGFSSLGYYYRIAIDKMINYVEDDLAICLENYIDGNAHYLDVTAKTSLDELIDYSQFNINSRTIAQGIKNNMDFNDAVRNAVGGPLTAEGGEHILQTIDSLLVGNIESYNREIFGREDAPVIPDFELISVKPLSANKGMGSIDRWIRPSGPVVGWWPPVVFSDFVIDKSDKYRATTIAFGHTGFVDDIFMFTQGSQATVSEILNYVTKEYYIFSKMQELYLGSDIESIIYYKNNQPMDTSTILKSFNSQTEQDTYFRDFVKLKNAYSNGLEVYVNRHVSENWQINVNGGDHYLPPNGWLAHHPASGLLVYSALVDVNGNPSPTGHRVDYVGSDEYIMVNGRGVQTSFGQDYFGNEINSTYLTVIKPNGWKLSETSFGEFLTMNSPISINSLNPSSFYTSSNPPWITVTRTTSSIPLSDNFGILIKESSNPQWPQNPPLYCFHFPSIGSGGTGTCEYIDSDTVRFRTEINYPPNNYDVIYTDLTNVNSPKYSNVVSLTVTPAQFCGDNICNGLESCSTCEQDCGACPGTIPNTPSGLTVGSPTASSLTLTWTDNSNDENGFIINYKLHSEANWSVINVTSPNAQSYIHTGLNSNTEYDYQILAYNSIGQSGVYPSSTTYVSGTTSAPPSPGSTGGSGGSSGGSTGSVRPTPVKPQCSDGKDNDNDGKIDYPADTGCLSSQDNAELDVPSTNTQIDEEDNTAYESETSESKEIRIRLIFWAVTGILLTGIAIVLTTIIRSINSRERFKQLTAKIKDSSSLNVKPEQF